MRPATAIAPPPQKGAPKAPGGAHTTHRSPPLPTQDTPISSTLNSRAGFNASSYIHTLSAAAVFLGVLVMAYNTEDVDPTQFASFEPVRKSIANIVQLCENPLRENRWQALCDTMGVQHDLVRSLKSSAVVPQQVARILSDSVSSLGGKILKNAPAHLEDAVPFLLLASTLLLVFLYAERVRVARQR